MDEKDMLIENQHTNSNKPKEVPVTKETIGNTVKQIFGNDAQALWSKGLYKSGLFLKVILQSEDETYSFVIDTDGVQKEDKLGHIARCLVTMYGRARAMALHEMALFAQENQGKKDAVQAEKDRMAGRKGD